MACPPPFFRHRWGLRFFSPTAALPGEEGWKQILPGEGALGGAAEARPPVRYEGGTEQWVGGWGGSATAAANNRPEFLALVVAQNAPPPANCPLRVMQMSARMQMPFRVQARRVSEREPRNYTRQ